MARFDDPGVYYSDPLYSEDGQSGADTDESNTVIHKKFQYDFLQTFIVDNTNVYCYQQ